MTKLTVLHFASPFAFSMPVPIPRADRGSVVTSEPTTAPRTSSTGVQFSFASGSAVEEDGPSAVSESAGFDANLYDTVLRRYREQIATGSDTAAHAEAETRVA